MYNFRQKKEIARRIAKAEHIPAYRQMLKERGSSDHSRIMSDKEALARSLVYNLLDYLTEEQIIAQSSPQYTRSWQGDTLPSLASSIANKATEVVRNIKKKVQNVRNTLASRGLTWTTLWSGLQTAYTQTVSTVTALWQRLKETLHRLLSWMLTHLQR